MAKNGWPYQNYSMKVYPEFGQVQPLGRTTPQTLLTLSRATTIDPQLKEILPRVQAPWYITQWWNFDEILTMCLPYYYLGSWKVISTGFFSTSPKKSRMKKNQNSSNKLKDSANFVVICNKNQWKGPKNRKKQQKYQKLRIKHSKLYWMGTILKQKNWVLEIFKHSLKTQGEKTQYLKQKT